MMCRRKLSSQNGSQPTAQVNAGSRGRIQELAPSETPVRPATWRGRLHRNDRQGMFRKVVQDGQKGSLLDRNGKSIRSLHLQRR